MRVSLVFLILLFASHSAFGEVLRKTGNNGTVTCSEFCAGPEWGGFGGMCLRGYDHDQNKSLRCDEGGPNLKNVSCICVKGHLKAGNNGTASCTDWCSRNGSNGPGPSLPCIGALRQDTNHKVACDNVPGFLNGAQHACWCQNSIRFSQDLLSNQLKQIESDVSALKSIESDLSSQKLALENKAQLSHQQLVSTQQELASKNADLDQAMAKVPPLEEKARLIEQEKIAIDGQRIVEADKLLALQERQDSLLKNRNALDSQITQKDELKKSLDAEAASLATTHSNLQQNLETTLKIKLDLVPDIVKTLTNQVGMLEFGHKICTAILVSPKRIRTAAHCIIDDGVKSGRFVLRGKEFGINSLDLLNREMDTAFLSIVGESDSYIDLISHPQVGDRVNLLAWNTETKNLTLSDACQILDFDEPTGIIKHNCFSRPGMSGGALINNGFIVVVHIGTHGSEKAANKISISDLLPWKSEFFDGLQFEYDCSSDCQKEATRKVLGNRIFDPTKFAACMAVRSTDCSARYVKEQAEEQERTSKAQQEERNRAAREASEQAARTERAASEEAARTERALREEAERVAIASKEELLRTRTNLMEELSRSADLLANQYEALEKGLGDLDEHTRKITTYQDILNGLQRGYEMAESQVIATKNDLGNLASQLDNLFSTIPTLENFVTLNEQLVQAGKDQLTQIRNQTKEAEAAVGQLSKDLTVVTDHLNSLEEGIKGSLSTIKNTTDAVVELKNQVNNVQTIVDIGSKFVHNLDASMAQPNELCSVLNEDFREMLSKNKPLFDLNLATTPVDWTSRIWNATNLDEKLIATRDIVTRDWISKAKSYLAKRRPFRERNLNIDMSEHEHLKKLRYCLLESSKVLDRYQDILAKHSSGIFSGSLSAMPIEVLVDASNEIQNEHKTLVDMHAEMMINGCTYQQMNLPLEKAIKDVQEWSIWLLHAKTQVLLKVGA